MLAKGLTDLSVRLTNTEIEIKKNSDNFEILTGRNELLKSTIELLEKQVEFNDKKN